MSPRIAQRGTGSARPLVVGFLVDPVALAKALGPLPCLVTDDAHGTATLPALVDFARKQAGFDTISTLALVGYSAGCQGVRKLALAGANASAYLLVDGTHASWPPQEWQISWLRNLANEARASHTLVVATHTEQSYTEHLIAPSTPYASTRTVLRLATGFPLDKDGPVESPALTREGDLWVYSYKSAPIDAPAHRAQGHIVLPELAKRHLLPRLLGVPPSDSGSSVGPVEPSSAGGSDRALGLLAIAMMLLAVEG